MGSLSFPAGHRILLDSNILIYYIEDLAPYSALLSPVFDGFRDRRYQAVVSGICLTEILVKPIRQGDESLVGLYKRLVLGSHDVELCEVTTDVLERAAGIRADHGLRTPDAIQVATAQVGACDVILTNDRRLGSVVSPQVIVLSDHVADE